MAIGMPARSTNSLNSLQRSIAIIEGCSEKTRCGLALYVPSDHLAQWDEFAPVARKADAQGKVVEREMRVAILLVAPGRDAVETEDRASDGNRWSGERCLDRWRSL